MNAWWKSHTNTYFTIQCVCMLVPESCLTLCNPMDCSLLGSSVHVILQARILEWVTISFSTSPNLGIKLGSPALRTDFFIIWATIQFSSVMCDPMDCQAPLSITNSQSLLKFMSIASVMPSNYLFLCHPFLLLLSIFPRTGSFPMSQLFTGREVSTQQIVWHSAFAPLHSVASFAVWLVSTVSSGQ